MPSDLIIQLTTGQSIKVNGKKIGPQIKEDKTSTCPDARENCILMSKTAPLLVPPQRAAFATEWSGSTAAGQVLCLCQRRLLQSCSPQLLGGSGRRRPPGNPRPPERGREDAQLRPCPTVPTGMCMALCRAGSCMGRVLKWGLHSDRFLKL